MNNKDKRLKKLKSLTISILILILLTSIILLLILKTEQKKENKNIEKEDIKNTTSTSLIMVGDNLIHSSIYEEANRNANYEGYDFKPMYKMIKSIVSNYDIAYYNQETIIGGSEIGLSSYPAFNSPYEVADAMIDAGFNLVSLATNHTLDRGKQAVLNSRNYWNSKENVLAVGSYSSQEERNKIDIRESNGITYTMLNYTYGTNGISVPKGENYLVNIWPMNGNNPEEDIEYQNYKQQVLEDIKRVRDKVDVLLVAMHWGIEYQNMPNDYQKDAAKFLSDNGVDIVIGTHPHVIEPIDYINNTLVIYSLGNFASAHEVVNMDNRVGLMTSLEIEKNLKTNKITIKNLENELLYMHYTNEYKDFLIVPFSKIDNSYLNNYQEVYEKYKNVITSLNSNIKVKKISTN
jgi:poly-gamma-glutamate capsule biosynthesis protein CapA/YwtB (metallophosphatase superfamily)